MTAFSEKFRIFFGLSEQARPWIPVIVALFAVSIAARFGLFWFLLETKPDMFYDDDSYGYVTLAENLENGNGFSWDEEPPYMPNSYRTPGYPMFLAAHDTLFGSFVPALATQIVLALLMAYLVLRIGDRHFSIKVGVIAAGVFLFMPFSLLIPMKYATQVFFTATIVGAAWFWSEYLAKGYAKYLILTSLLLPIAAIIRPIAILIVVPFIASLVFARVTSQVSWKRVFGTSVVLCAVFFVGILPWMWRNHETFGQFSLSSLVPHQLYFYDAPSIYAAAHGISHTEGQIDLQEHIKELTGIPYAFEDKYMQFSELTPVIMKEGLKIAFEDPMVLIKTRIVQFGKFFVRDGARNWLEPYGIDPSQGTGFGAVVLERVILAIITAGFFFSAIYALLTKNTFAVCLALIVLYFAALTGVMAAAGLRYPAEPLFLVLGIAGIFQILSLAKKFSLKRTH